MRTPMALQCFDWYTLLRLAVQISLKPEGFRGHDGIKQIVIEITVLKFNCLITYWLPKDFNLQMLPKK